MSDLGRSGDWRWACAEPVRTDPLSLTTSLRTHYYAILLPACSIQSSPNESTMHQTANIMQQLISRTPFQRKTNVIECVSCKPSMDRGMKQG